MKQVVAFVAIGIAVLAIAACGGGGEPEPPEEPTEPAAVVETPTTPAGGETPTEPPAGGGGDTVEVLLQDPGGEGDEYAFNPNEFTFNAGEEVTFTLTADTEFHTFTVDALGIDQQVDAGETVTFTQTFDEPGTYDLICIPHESLGMTGTITVQ